MREPSFWELQYRPRKPIDQFFKALVSEKAISRTGGVKRVLAFTGRVRRFGPLIEIVERGDWYGSGDIDHDFVVYSETFLVPGRYGICRCHYKIQANESAASLRNPYYRVRLSENKMSINSVVQDGDHFGTVPVVDSDRMSYLYIRSHCVYRTNALFVEKVASLATKREYGEATTLLSRLFFPKFPQSD